MAMARAVVFTSTWPTEPQSYIDCVIWPPGGTMHIYQRSTHRRQHFTLKPPHPRCALWLRSLQTAFRTCHRNCQEARGMKSNSCNRGMSQYLKHGPSGQDRAPLPFHFKITQGQLISGQQSHPDWFMLNKSRGQVAYTLLRHFSFLVRTVGAKHDSSSSLSLSVSALGSSPSSASFFTSVENTHACTRLAYHPRGE